VRQVFELTCGEGGDCIASNRPSSSKGAFLQLGLSGLRGRKIAGEGLPHRGS